MPEAKFVLKEPKSQGETLIFLFYRFNGNSLKYSTGQKIKPKFWNPTKQRAKITLQFPAAGKLNETLKSLSRGVVDAHLGLINNKKLPTPHKLKEELNKLLFKEEHAQAIGLLKFVPDLLKHSNRKPSTNRQLKQTFKKLLEYKTLSNTEVDYATIDLDFYDKFVQFLTKKGYSKNTIGGHVKNIKIFMNEAVARKLTSNLEYKSKRFKVLEEQVDKIYLNQEEIKVIYELDLTENERLERVRDLFIVACYTGLRFSDLIQVTKENFINDGTQIRVRTNKTGEIVNIPVHKFIKQIITKYNGNLPPTISNEKMNQYLKEIGKLAMLEDNVPIGITRGGKLQHEVFKKSALISTHTARRSFATNAFLMAIPPISIMKITGHKTEKSFMKYIKISPEDNANKLATHPFFN